MHLLRNIPDGLLLLVNLDFEESTDVGVVARNGTKMDVAFLGFPFWGRVKASSTTTTLAFGSP